MGWTRWWQRGEKKGKRTFKKKIVLSGLSATSATANIHGRQLSPFFCLRRQTPRFGLVDHCETIVNNHSSRRRKKYNRSTVTTEDVDYNSTSVVITAGHLFCNKPKWCRRTRWYSSFFLGQFGLTLRILDKWKNGIVFSLSWILDFCFFFSMSSCFILFSSLVYFSLCCRDARKSHGRPLDDVDASIFFFPDAMQVLPNPRNRIDSLALR